MMRLISRFLACALLTAAVAGAATPVRILIAYHSRTGNTEKMAAAVREGAASVTGVEIVLRKVDEVTSDEIVKADGIDPIAASNRRFRFTPARKSSNGDFAIRWRPRESRRRRYPRSTCGTTMKRPVNASC